MQTAQNGTNDCKLHCLLPLGYRYHLKLLRAKVESSWHTTSQSYTGTPARHDGKQSGAESRSSGGQRRDDSFKEAGFTPVREETFVRQPGHHCRTQRQGFLPGQRRAHLAAENQCPNIRVWAIRKPRVPSLPGKGQRGGFSKHYFENISLGLACRIV